ncbi:MAG: hypothetical protein IT305_23810 [Chloroflexi bacterium]|nr:hypothetical protein [Chloroflexota bacterium]
MAQATALEARDLAPTDPYHVTGAEIMDPPEGWLESLKHFGPGMILSASTVGSGE